MAPEDKYKFVDDLQILEILTLPTIGMSSFNVKYSVPNDNSDHNQIIENLENTINDWTNNHKMKINKKKTK